MKLEFSRQISEKKNTRIEFHENTSTESRVVPCGRMDRQTDMTKLLVAFRNFVNAPKIVMAVHFVSYSVPPRSAGIEGGDHGALDKTALPKLLMGKCRVT